MGMDVMGNNPISEKGEYFRNNVWWWRPLWNYCIDLDPTLEERVPAGHYNDGDGLKTDEECKALANLILDSISNGFADRYIRERNEMISLLEWDECKYCEGSGIRKDSVGIDHGMDKEALPEDKAILYGRTHGTCNGCHGFGKTEPWEAHYPLDKENMVGFAEFLADCGGFSIC